MKKLIREIDDLELVPCSKHRECVVGCEHCTVVRQVKYYELPERWIPKTRQK